MLNHEVVSFDATLLETESVDSLNLNGYRVIPVN